MSCHICSRTHNSRRPFYCPTCARNQLYQLRVDNSRALLEKEAIGRQIEDAVARGGSKAESTEPEGTATRLQDDAPRRWALQVATSRQAESAARTSALNNRIKSLKAGIKDKQTEISERKAVLSRRYSDAESAKYQLIDREASVLDGIQNNAMGADHAWRSLYSKTVECRIFLCREAASLYGLRQKTVDKDGAPQVVYVIGGVPIIDLRDLNSEFRPPIWP